MVQRPRLTSGRLWLVAVFVKAVMCQQRSKPPIILIPGAGGSRIMAAINKATVPNQLCSKRDTKFQLWPTPAIAVPLAVDCWIDNMRLTYNEGTGLSADPPGVESFIPGFGDTESIEFLTDVKLPASQYFHKIVHNAVRSWGYQRGKDIHGAPYDFRKSPHEQQLYFLALKNLIESSYARNGNQAVVLIAHSLGNLYTLYFLHDQSQEWKDKYIKTYFAIGGPLGGALTAVKAFASGYDLDSAVLAGLKLRTAERTWLSTAVMLPSSPFWGVDEPFAFQPARNYTVNDYPAFFQDIGYPQGLSMHNAVRNMLKPIEPPRVEDMASANDYHNAKRYAMHAPMLCHRNYKGAGVQNGDFLAKVHCVVGTKQKTSFQVRWAKGMKFPDSKPKDEFEDGDGTVPTRSANICRFWQTSQRQSATTEGFPRVNHLHIISDSSVLKHLEKIIMNTTSIPIIDDLSLHGHSSRISLALPLHHLLACFVLMVYAVLGQ